MCPSARYLPPPRRLRPSHHVHTDVSVILQFAGCHTGTKRAHSQHTHAQAAPLISQALMTVISLVSAPPPVAGAGDGNVDVVHSTGIDAGEGWWLGRSWSQGRYS